MYNLNKKLDAWVQAGLITSDQQQAILNHEDAPSERSWVVFGISAIGVVALATGFISMIAANWEEIPDSAKLFLYFLVLLSALAFSFKKLGRSTISGELTLAFIALWYLAGIGLVGQLYHLEGTSWQAFGFWCVLTLPLALIAKNRLNAHLWFLGFGCAVGFWIGSDIVPQKMAEHRVFSAMSLPFIFYAIGVAGAGFLPENFRNRALTYATLALAALSVFAQFLWSDPPAGMRDVTPDFSAMIVAAGFAAVLAYFRFRSENPLLAIFAALAVVVSCANVVIPAYLHVGPHQVIGTAMFVFAWGTAAAAAASARRRRMFDACTAVIGIRLVVVYFEVFGSLAATGVGLVISGLLIIGVAKLWHSKRNAIAALLQSGAATAAAGAPNSVTNGVTTGATKR